MKIDPASAGENTSRRSASSADRDAFARAMDIGREGDKQASDSAEPARSSADRRPENNEGLLNKVDVGQEDAEGLSEAVVRVRSGVNSGMGITSFPSNASMRARDPDQQVPITLQGDELGPGDADEVDPSPITRSASPEKLSAELSADSTSERTTGKALNGEEPVRSVTARHPSLSRALNEKKEQHRPDLAQELRVSPTAFHVPLSALHAPSAPASLSSAKVVSLAEIVAQTADRLMVDDGTSGRRGVRIDLKDDVLPGVSVSVFEDQGQLVADFTCSNDVSYTRLGASAPALAAQLANSLRRDARVDVRGDDLTNQRLVQEEAVPLTP